MKRLVMVPLFLLVCDTVLAAPPSCSPAGVIAEHVQWLGAAKNNRVRVTAVSNQRNRLVSFAEGDLTVTGSTFPGSGAPTYLGGTLKQYFSDRKYDLPSAGGVAVPRYPFSPMATDALALSIASDARISLGLKSWGNSVIRLTDVGCTAGVLYGLTDNTSGPRSLYVISLAREVSTASGPVK